MASCPGKKPNGSTCYTLLYRCKKCGNVGCTQRGCSNQGFDAFGRCVKCGSAGSRETFR